MQIEGPRTDSAGLDEGEELLAVARAELDDRGERRKAPEDVASVQPEEPQLGPCDAIPGQQADRLEERRAELVVEVPRRQLARRERQVVLDVARKLGQKQAGFRPTSGF